MLVIKICVLERKKEERKVDMRKFVARDSVFQMGWPSIYRRQKETLCWRRVRPASDTAPEHGRPSKKWKLRKRTSKADSSAPKLGQAKGMDEADLNDFCAKIKNSLERDEVLLDHHLLGLRSMLLLLGLVLLLEVLLALARDAEYDQIPEDDFGTAIRVEEIDLTLFPLIHGPYYMYYPYEGLVTARNHLQEKFDRKAGYVKVKELQTELTDARVASIESACFGKAKSQRYKDVVDGLREEVTRFVGSDVESLVRKLLSSDEFHAALAHIASLGINYGVESRLRMGRTDAEFEVAAQKFSNFHIGAKTDFDKALVDFPTTPFPFLGKIVVASGGTLSEVTQVLPDKHIRSVTSAPVAPPIASKDADQVPLEHASYDLAASI
ncbi:hypothetical protein Tco_1265320 [Tanacetum coccineum]